MTPATSSSGLVPNLVSRQPCIPPNRDDWDHLFQSMFDEYFNPPTFAVSPVHVAAAPRAVDLADSPMSTLIDQDALSTSVVDPTLFTRKAGNDLLRMTTKFKISMMGQMSFFLGLQISQSPRGIFINQSKYAFEIAKKYGMLSSDSVDTPLVEKSNLDKDLQGKPVDATLYCSMIGSLIYLKSSKPDLTYAATINMGLWYSKDTDMSLTAYADADHAGCQDTRRSTSRSAQLLGDKLVSWSFKKQKSIAISSTEDQVEDGIVELYFVRTEYQLADIFTKPLPRERFKFLIEKLSMRTMSPETLKSLAEETDE
nr:hypothetical protein [Tanacetum cinerariifolium]